MTTQELQRIWWTARGYLGARWWGRLVLKWWDEALVCLVALVVLHIAGVM